MPVQIRINAPIMERLLEEKGWTRSELARQLRTVPSVVTRFMNNEYGIGAGCYHDLLRLFPDQPGLFIRRELNEDHRTVEVVTVAGVTSSGA